MLDERYDFLKNVNLSELEGKDEDVVIFKGIKFNKEERELLQFVQWKGVRFSNYVKQLIEQDMRNTIEGVKEGNKPNIDESYIKALIEQVLDSRECLATNESEVETIKKEVDGKAIGALGKLGINKR